MKISESVYAIGGGDLGYKISNAFDCNIYLVDGGGEYVVIDAGSGMDSNAIVAWVQRDGIAIEQIKALILTHAHADHAGGASKLRHDLSVPVLAGSLTADIVASGDEARISLPEARRNGIYPAWYRFKACPIDRALCNGETIAIGSLTLQVIAVPGHSADMIALYCPELGALFAGDTVFSGGMLALQSSPDFSLSEYRRTIASLSSMNLKQLFSGHGTAILEHANEHIMLAHRRFEAGEPPESIV
jgi:hydroxyacylglutathione hydrolase